MVKKTTCTGIVRVFKPMKIGLTCNVIEEEKQLFLGDKKINDVFRELLGISIKMKIRETSGRVKYKSRGYRDSYYYGVVEDGNELFFENGGSRVRPTDVFHKYIGQEIDIDIKFHPPRLWLLLPQVEDNGCGCCCD